MAEYKVLNNSSKIGINGFTENRAVEDTGKEAVKEELRKTGIDIIGDVSWGAHLCVFYESKEDLIDILVPYFKTGLENNEFCVWVTSEPLKAEEAKSSLRQAVKNLDDYIEKGRIEIMDYNQWYAKSGKFESDKVLKGWGEKEAWALKNGFDGLRVTGNTSWIGKNEWRNFADYEATVNDVIGSYHILAICTYSLEKCSAAGIIDVISAHQVAFARCGSKWELVESFDRRKARETLFGINKCFLSFNSNPDENIRKIVETAGSLFKGVCALYNKKESAFLYAIEGWNIPKDFKRKDSRDGHICYDVIAKYKDEPFVINNLGKTSYAKTDPNVTKYNLKTYIGCAVKIDNEAIGSLCVVYQENRTFSSNELNTLSIFAEALGIEEERKRAEEALRESELKLREQSLALEQKNLALKEMIEHIERTKNRLEDEIMINLDEIVLPILKKLKIKGASPKYIKLLEYHLKELVSSFGRKITQRTMRLTPREIEICNMVKGGLTTKNLSELLNISCQTIEKHRKNIRKKLGLANKKANLTSYLQKI